MSQTFPLRLDPPVQAIHARLGSTITFRGALHNSLDGSTIDAALTQWPENAPAGASIDAGGIVDLEAGGLHLVRRNPQTHEVQAIAASDNAPACARANVASPCLVLRTAPQALSHLQTTAEYGHSLKGAILVEIDEPSVSSHAAVHLRQFMPVARATMAGLALIALVLLVGVLIHRHRQSEGYRLRCLVARARKRLVQTDPVLAMPLIPVVDAAEKAIRQGKLEAASEPGRRVGALLGEIIVRMDEAEREQRAQRQEAQAEGLAEQFQIALEAANEAKLLAGSGQASEQQSV